MSVEKNGISTDQAPAAIGPYEQAIECNGFVFLSGQLGLDPTDLHLPSTIEEQTRNCLANIAAVLDAANMTRNNVVKTTVFLTDMQNFSAVNQLYGEFFAKTYPARSLVAVKELPKGGAIEIECIAMR